ncbi:hypothetical protein KUG85_10980 [Nitratireductor sp. L1-7-SE]|uniref:Uncharacterized protein n=1 Tax=Nitratireductor rhodophyticola TaxID=2854036 RepID=A0ABS7RAM2_9HYPH|nr:hypothetical protein [Nitratireductor rhodophyticola]MBY8917968.1 hypothetical protein [Nitratireductor rhodophyticola]MBY8921223.1 hypothetical protein [Nitratireductor rhodophyticola]
MNEYFPIFAPVIGIVGVVVGVLLNEFMRRRNRREIYAPKIFEKRLAAYEGLIEQIHQGSKVANEVIERDDFTEEQRHDVIGTVVHGMAEFTEKNRLYLNEDLTVHCMALFMGVEDIHDASEEDRQELLEHYRQMRKDALRMAAEDSGVAEINRLFNAINKPKIDGALIRYFREVKREATRGRSGANGG